MALPPRLFTGDDEMGKKDDDHKPGRKSSLRAVWQQRRISHGPHKRMLKRAALGTFALIVVYIFFKSMPTHLPNPNIRSHLGQSPQNAPQENGSKPPVPANQGSMPNAGHEETTAVSPHYFNGPIQFYQLASTLHAVRAKDRELTNRNVVSVNAPTPPRTG